MITQSWEAFSVQQRTGILCNEKLQCLENRNNRNEIKFNRTKCELLILRNNINQRCVSEVEAYENNLCVLAEQYKYELLV